MEYFSLVDGLRVRYLEQGTGPAVILLHGASLGSSADVWDAHEIFNQKVLGFLSA